MEEGEGEERWRRAGEAREEEEEEEETTQEMRGLFVSIS